MFTAAVGLAQRLFVAVTHETSDAALVGATLVVATLYAPLRKRLEAIVDRYYKYEDHRFGAYREEVARYLSLIDPGLAAARLVTEAVRETGSIGTAVLDARQHAIASAGIWPLDPSVAPTVIAIEHGSETFHSIALGPRSDGLPLDPESVVALEDLARLAAQAAAPRQRTR